MKFLLIKAMVEQHTYTLFERSLARALIEIGHEAHITDQAPHFDQARERASAANLLEVLRGDKYDAAISLGSYFGSAKFVSGLSIYDGLGVRLLNWMFDHPVYSPQSLDRSVQGRLAVYCSHDHLRFAQAVKLPGAGTVMAPGVDPAPAPPRPFADRQWPLVVAATFREEPRRFWEDQEDSPAKKLLGGVADRLLEDREACLLDAVTQTSLDLNLGFQFGHDPQLDFNIGHLVRLSLTYVRNLDRLRVLRALVESGLPVTICGDGWRDYFSDRKNVTYMNRIPFSEVDKFYGNARAVLNLNGPNGASERMFQAAMNGAAPVSDYSRPLADFFGESISLFDRVRPEGVVDAVAPLLEGDRAEQLAAQAHEKVQRAGLWRHRAQDLVDFVAAH